MKALCKEKMICSAAFAILQGHESPTQTSCSLVTANNFCLSLAGWLLEIFIPCNHSARACYVFLSYQAKTLLDRFSPLQGCQYPVHGSWHQTRRPCDGDITHNSRVLADTGCVFKNRYYNILGRASEYTKNIESVFSKCSIISSILIGSKHTGYHPILLVIFGMWLSSLPNDVLWLQCKGRVRMYFSNFTVTVNLKSTANMFNSKG